MGLDDTLRRKLILLKEENRYSNQDIARMIGDCTGQSVGRWIVSRDAYISDDNICKIIGLVKDVDYGIQGIKNTPELRQVIISKSMKLNMGFSHLSEKIGNQISPSELEVLLSDEGADFTPKTLSLICAVLDLKKSHLPISEDDKASLFINAMKSEMLLSEIPVFSFEEFRYNNVIIGSLRDEVVASEKYLIAGLDKTKSYAAMRAPQDDTLLLIAKGDLLILSEDGPMDKDIVLLNQAQEFHLAKMNSESRSFIACNNMKIPINRDHLTFVYKVEKIIRDL